MIGWTEIALILVVILLLFGPSKLPELAKSVGEAMREYRKASSEILSPPPTPKPTEEQLLIDTAKKLGISTERKTKEQIAEEIVKKAAEVGKEESAEKTRGAPVEKKEG